MSVKRITANLNAPDIPALKAFYTGLFGLDVLMDLGWIATLGTAREVPVQLSLATTGGEGTPVPEISIEVEGLDAIHARAKELGYDVLYGIDAPVEESWGVRRFMLHDPADNLVNVLEHAR